MSEQNLGLWRRHCHTNPSDTKSVNQRGGYTAINPGSQIEAATAEWGPYGLGWGLSGMNYYRLEISNATPADTLALECEFWAVTPAGKVSFPIAADMPFKAGDDCMKKLRTQCQSKSLSMLGFSADVYSGQWDETGYQASMTAKFGDQDKRLAEGLRCVAAATDGDALDKLGVYIDDQAGRDLMDSTRAEQLRAKISERREEIAA